MGIRMLLLLFCVPGSVYMCVGVCVCVILQPLHLIDVEPESHILLFNSESLWQVIMNVLYSTHSAEAASVD